MSQISMVQCDGCQKRAEPAVDDMQGWIIASLYKTIDKENVVEMEPLDFCGLACLAVKISPEMLVPKPKVEEPEVEQGREA